MNEDRPPALGSALFRVDSTPRIGDGHVARCLSLADGLARRGVRSAFVAGHLSPTARDAIAGRFAIHDLSDAMDPGLAGTDWDLRPWPDAEQGRQAAATLAVLRRTGADLLVVDHYLLDHQFESALRGEVARIVAIDDLANRRHDCDLLVDHNLGRRASDYRGLVPEGARLCCGPAFALLRPQFGEARDSLLEQGGRATAGRPRLLISLGSTDVGGITGQVLSALIAAGIDDAVQVVIAAEAPSRAACEALAASHSGIVLHDRVGDMAGLMARCDLAIGAGGTTSWERCALGLPSVIMVLADNQRAVAEELAAAGAARLAHSPAQAAAAVAGLLARPSQLEAMAAAAFALVDGRGVDRVCQALLAPSGEPPAVRIRAATLSHSAAIWAWRNDPVTRASSRNSEPIRWQDHRRWYQAALAGSLHTILVAEVDALPVAMVRFNQSRAGEPAEVSINVSPEARGRGIGGLALEGALHHFDRESGSTPLVADIKRGNHASRRLFTRVGFRPRGSLDEFDFETYEMPPRGPTRHKGVSR